MINILKNEDLATLKYLAMWIVFLIVVLIFSVEEAKSSGAGHQAKTKKSVGVGYFYSEGRFYDNDFSTLKSMPLYFKIQRKLTSLKISSYLYRFRREDSISNATQQSSGWGSSYLTLKHIMPVSRFIHYLDIEGKGKIPAGKKDDDLKLSGIDFKLGSTAYYYVKKNWITASFAYRWRGGQLYNSYLIGAGISRKMTNDISGGIQVEFESKTQKTSTDKFENTFYLQWKQDKKFKYSVYAIKGFNDLKLDWGLGFQVSYGW